MMTVVSTEPSGCVEREPEGKGHRKVAILYGRSRFGSRASAGRRAGGWELTPAEQWALDHERCIGVKLKDDARELLLPPHQRPQLVQLGAPAWAGLPGGVLVEDLDGLGTQQSGFDPWVYVGSGPRRDVQMARDVDAALRDDGWSDRRIRDYLSLYGFANPSGKVGVWNHANHKTLRSRR